MEKQSSFFGFIIIIVIILGTFSLGFFTKPIVDKVLKNINSDHAATTTDKIIEIPICHDPIKDTFINCEDCEDKLAGCWHSYNEQTEQQIKEVKELKDKINTVLLEELKKYNELNGELAQCEQDKISLNKIIDEWYEKWYQCNDQFVVCNNKLLNK